ncbi:DNA methyltransferase [Bifidobacterium sp. SO1]|uniref:DNA methyltransferase n=1 Tax=Bifidobacterium sp. SO1 TaxID=2809029 RepID=UPI001BDD38D5|nr:DNA methyltransferase [Bifidobacterium sp. SO1]MBT1161847.1 site-specific DNA-methyltransferase [Bifidobacterium sp. SO1]
MNDKNLCEWDGGRLRLHVADCRTMIAALPDNSVDSVVTDPPYELDFMGRDWDRTGITFDHDLWTDILRVLKPGGHVCAFAATRTYHRLACAIEDAGFEIRDQIDWVYMNGFPHGMNATVTIDRQRRSDRETIRRVCAWLRDRLDETDVTVADLAREFDVSDSLIHHWTAGPDSKQPAIPGMERWQRLKELLHFDSTMDETVRRLNERKNTPSDEWERLPVLGEHASKPAGCTGERFTARDNLIREPSDTAKPFEGWHSQLKPMHEPICLARKPLEGTLADNLLTYGTGALNIDATRVPVTGRDREDYENAWRQDGDDGPKSNRIYGNYNHMKGGRPGDGRFTPNMIIDQEIARTLDRENATSVSSRHKDRSTVKERVTDTGWRMRGGLGSEYDDRGGISRFIPIIEYVPKPSDRERPTVDDTYHPTVKPVELMRRLIRLVTPQNGLVLEPFAGSGTTLEACRMENMRCEAAELSPEYARLIQSRMSRPIIPTLI